MFTNFDQVEKEMQKKSKYLIGVACLLVSLFSLLPCIYSIYAITDNDFSHCKVLFYLLIVLTVVPIIMFVLSLINSAMMCRDKYTAYKVFAGIIMFLYIGFTAIAIVIVIKFKDFSTVNSEDKEIVDKAKITGQKSKLAGVCASITSAISLIIIIVTAYVTIRRYIKKKNAVAAPYV